MIQYLEFLRRAVFHGDLGRSFVYNTPTITLMAKYFPATFKLAMAAIVFINLVAVPLGIIAAIRRYSFIDNVATFIALIGQAMPLYWLGIMLIIIFGVWLRWLPISGSDSFAHMILPAITLGSWILPVNMRLVRSGMLEVLHQDYIRTARAKGLAENKVLYKHAFRNAAVPLLTVIGMQFGLLLGGAVVTETVFAWPGLGRLAVDSIRMGDYPVVQAIVVMFAMCVVLANLAADIAAALIDPRIRFDKY